MKLDTSATIGDDMSREPRVHRIERSELDAVVSGKTEQIDVDNTSVAKIIREPGRLAMIVIEEPAVAINPWIASLTKHLGDDGAIQVGMKLRSVRFLDTVNWPQNLVEPIQRDDLPRLGSGMIRREAAMIRWMPILRGYDETELGSSSIRNWHDFVATRYREGAARTKIVLDIDQDERFRGLRLQTEAFLRESLARGRSKV
jgi:hypothetical protein